MIPEDLIILVISFYTIQEIFDYNISKYYILTIYDYCIPYFNADWNINKLLLTGNTDELAKTIELLNKNRVHSIYSYDISHNIKYIIKNASLNSLHTLRLPACNLQNDCFIWIPKTLYFLDISHNYLINDISNMSNDLVKLNMRGLSILNYNCLPENLKILNVSYSNFDNDSLSFLPKSIKIFRAKHCYIHSFQLLPEDLEELYLKGFPIQEYIINLPEGLKKLSLIDCKILNFNVFITYLYYLNFISYIIYLNFF